MAFKDMSGRTAAWNADEVRTCLAGTHPDDVQVVDVRSREAYAELHLPGAINIPAEALPERWLELNAERLTIVCCGHGELARAAAQVLRRAGFREVHPLDDGLDGWPAGASGLPERVAAPLLETGSPAEQAVLAWQVEEASRCFYGEMAKTLKEPRAAALFADLAKAEQRHKDTLRAVWEGLTGQAAGDDFPAGLTVASDGRRMEGGMFLEEALAWAGRSTPGMILEYAMALELGAYDQYLYLSRHAGHPDSARLFEVLAAEERRHLRAFGEALDTLGKAS